MHDDLPLLSMPVISSKDKRPLFAGQDHVMHADRRWALKTIQSALGVFSKDENCNQSMC